jgi:hypothetical protein
VYRTLGLVLQNENFIYNRYTNHIMDSWSYMDTPISKPRLNPGDDLTAITMLYEQCKVANALNQNPDKKQTISRMSRIPFDHFVF